MTVTLETPSSTRSAGDEAFDRVDDYREKIGEQFELRPLDEEFAFYMRRLGATGLLYLADATNNPAGTFKWRGALSKMAKLRDSGKTSSRLASAGNHLIGAALVGNVLSQETPDMQLHGFVPTTASAAKKQGARRLWDSSSFQLHEMGRTFDDTLHYAMANEHLGELVPPYDDPDVAAGQGTIADDILAESARSGVEIRHVVVPVGGGGLFSGLARRFYELGTNVTVHGIEGEGNDSLSRSASTGGITQASRVNGRYGGAAVKYTGGHTLDTYLGLPNTTLWGVSDAEVAAVAEDYLDEIQYRDLGKNFSPLEPTSLVAVAGLARVAGQHPGETTAVVGTGRNAPLDDLWNKH